MVIFVILPTILFVPSVKCPACHHVNDHHFAIVSYVDVEKKVSHSLEPGAKLQFDLTGVNQRLHEIQDYDIMTRCSTEARTILARTTGRCHVVYNSPRDVCRFRIFKDRHGKTQVHNNGCHFFGKREYNCQCPIL